MSDWKRGTAAIWLLLTPPAARRYLMDHGRDAALVLVVMLVGFGLALWLWNHQTDRLNAVLREFEATRDDGKFEQKDQLTFLKDLLKIEFDARGAVVQIGLGTAVLASLYFTYRNMRTSQQNLRIATETLLTTQKGQVTERFTRAVDQLGAVEDGAPNLEVRLGGIYALEGIFRDSEEYRQSVVAVLSAYIRQNAQAGRPTDPGAQEHEQANPSTQPAAPARPPLRLREDVSTALGVFRRLPEIPGVNQDHAIAQLAQADLHHLDLTDVWLSRANLRRANLRRANLTDAYLQEANLMDAYLQEANLERANLSGANLGWANLSGAKLRWANLTEAGLKWANLTEADLTRANLTRADLTRADLTRADLTRANLTRANLKHADLTGAVLTDAIVVGTILEAATTQPPESPADGGEISITHPETESPPDTSTSSHP